MLYVDTSAVVRCYLSDEPDHLRLRKQIFDSQSSVITSELTKLELANAAEYLGMAAP